VYFAPPLESSAQAERSSHRARGFLNATHDGRRIRCTVDGVVGQEGSE